MTTRATAWMALLFSGLLLVGGGCASTIAYNPDETRVEKLGVEEGRLELSRSLSRAVAPRMGAIDVTEDHVRYGWQETVPGPFYVPITTSHENQIHFSNIDRIDIYSNNYVFIWGPQGRVDKILFASEEEARAFADLLMSFRARARK